MIQAIVKHYSSIKRLLRYWWYDMAPREVMTIAYDVETNTVECDDWIGKRINGLSGALTDELWRKIGKYCRGVNYNKMHTQIYIWAGERKYLAHCEPATDYLNNKELLKTGNGYHFGSGKRYGHKLRAIKCRSCGRPFDN